VILETGFGLGVNFLAAWQAWRDDPHRPLRLHFVSIEQHPVAPAALLSHAPPELAAQARALAAAWPLPLPGLHRCGFDDDRVLLTLAFGDARAVVPQLALGVDAFFLDGFAPSRNPQLWEPALIKALARHARPEATLATYTASTAVRESLVGAGFDVQARAGYGSKREMTVARFAPRWRMRRHEPPVARTGARSAIVIGAGLAGCATALALAQRGWTVTILDRSQGPAHGASALPAGLLHPQVTADDGRLARLTRAGFFAARAALQRLAPDGDGRLWRAAGVLQRLDATQARGAPAIAQALGLPPAYAVFTDAAAIQAQVGALAGGCGWWFPGGAAVAPAVWCERMLGAGGGAVRFRGEVEVTAIRSAAGAGVIVEVTAHRAAGAADVTVGVDRAPLRADAVVVAGAMGVAALLPLRDARLHAVRGRASLLAPDAIAGLRAGVAGDGYVVPALQGAALVGATYEPPEASGVAADRGGTATDGPVMGDSGAGAMSDVERGSGGRAAHAAGDLHAADVHRANLARLARLLAVAPPVVPIGVFDAVRCVSHDRLPLAGAVVDAPAVQSDPQRWRGAHLMDLPRMPGVFVLAALGSRGLTLATLSAQLIAAQLEGEPAPLTRDLIDALCPGRFLLRRLR
jgi:tRNA 5-methylaminomethyl-2-thiouridine biosynthesis bifunctional protein